MKPKWIILIIIVVFIVGILGYVLFSQKAPIQTAQPIVISTSTAPSETYGMSQYIDPTYGFSFWYPSALQITATTTNDNSENDSTNFPGGVAVETLQVGPAGGVTIYVVNSPTSNITDEPANHASPIAQTQYFYDSTSGQWMVDYPQGTNGGNSAATTTANVSKTTMSGLVILPSGRRFDTTIIPLSTTRFLVIGDGGGSSFTSQLAETVAQTGASINASAEAAALQAEASAYAPAKPHACSEVAKECPDGSYVGPTGPDCTFVCPNSTTSTASNIQQLNAPGNASLRQGDIAEIRNESFYFTLQSISSSSATIQITPVGCWNSFPSDTPPQVRCMIATVLIPPQTLSIGQTYGAANYGITLTQISDAIATFSVSASSTVQ
jgi:hypothetical protein